MSTLYEIPQLFSSYGSAADFLLQHNYEYSIINTKVLNYFEDRLIRFDGKYSIAFIIKNKEGEKQFSITAYKLITNNSITNDTGTNKQILSI